MWDNLRRKHDENLKLVASDSNYGNTTNND